MTHSHTHTEDVAPERPLIQTRAGEPTRKPWPRMVNAVSTSRGHRTGNTDVTRGSPTQPRTNKTLTRPSIMFQGTFFNQREKMRTVSKLSEQPLKLIAELGDAGVLLLEGGPCIQSPRLRRGATTGHGIEEASGIFLDAVVIEVVLLRRVRCGAGLDWPCGRAAKLVSTARSVCSHSFRVYFISV